MLLTTSCMRLSMGALLPFRLFRVPDVDSIPGIRLCIDFLTGGVAVLASPMESIESIILIDEIPALRYGWPRFIL